METTKDNTLEFIAPTETNVRKPDIRMQMKKCNKRGCDALIKKGETR
jgi:hypothetical protein